jgi:hypothetical protein
MPPNLPSFIGKLEHVIFNRYHGIGKPAHETIRGAELERIVHQFSACE